MPNAVHYDELGRLDLVFHRLNEIRSCRVGPFKDIVSLRSSGRINALVNRRMAQVVWVR